MRPKSFELDIEGPEPVLFEKISMPDEFRLKVNDINLPSDLKKLVLGEGAFGKVLFAQKKDGTPVALKLCKPSKEVPGLSAPLLLREIEALRRVKHPNSTRLIGVGLAPETLSNGRRAKSFIHEKPPSPPPSRAKRLSDMTPAEVISDAASQGLVLAIALEFVEGGNLKQLMVRQMVNPGSRLLTWGVRLRLMSDIAEGMRAIHEAGVLHRDLKPDNILLTSKDPSVARAKIADFGLARLETRRERIFRESAVASSGKTASHKTAVGSSGKTTDGLTRITASGTGLPAPGPNGMAGTEGSALRLRDATNINHSEPLPGPGAAGGPQDSPFEMDAGAGGKVMVGQGTNGMNVSLRISTDQISILEPFTDLESLDRGGMSSGDNDDLIGLVETLADRRRQAEPFARHADLVAPVVIGPTSPRVFPSGCTSFTAKSGKKVLLVSSSFKTNSLGNEAGTPISNDGFNSARMSSAWSGNAAGGQHHIPSERLAGGAVLPGQVADRDAATPRVAPASRGLHYLVTSGSIRSRKDALNMTLLHSMPEGTPVVTVKAAPAEQATAATPVQKSGKSIRFAEPAAAPPPPPRSANVSAPGANKTSGTGQASGTTNGTPPGAAGWNIRASSKTGGLGGSKLSRSRWALSRRLLNAASRITRSKAGAVEDPEAPVPQQAISDFAGTYLYAAPEVLMRGPCTKASEVFSYGILIYEICRGCPFALVYQSEDEAQDHLNRIVTGWRPDIPTAWPAILSALIERCWAENPSDRPSFAEVCAFLDSNRIRLEDDCFMLDSGGGCSCNVM